jgi:thiosulfate/3-mercaptopyruvate sulfurtransferase
MKSQPAAIMPYANPHFLVSTDWLQRHLGQPDLRILDASWHLPSARRDPRAEYQARHVPGTVFFDIEAISDPATSLPHMLPSPESFAEQMAALGIGEGDRIVIYDATGMMSAPRAWWMLRHFGARDVAVLDGGLPKWLAEGRPIESAPVRLASRPFAVRPDKRMVRDKAQIRANLQSRREQMLDARSAGRFQGTEPETWPGRRAGHIPGAANLPYPALLKPDQTFRDAESLRAAFASAGLDPARPVICSCGSGITACILALGLALIGAEAVSVYDGSWAEWGLPGDTPVALGA